MTKRRGFEVFITAAFVCAVSAHVSAGTPEAAKPVARAAPSVPAKDDLLSLETSAYEAWKSKDKTFWESFLSDKFVGWGLSGRLDKASATKEYTGADCEIKSYAISNLQLTSLARDAALITHKTAVDGTCDGQKNLHSNWAATVYVRDDNQWKAAFHAEAAIVDPAAPAVQPAGKTAGSEQQRTKSPDRDARTVTLLLLEKAIWDAWKDHDVKRLDDLTETNVQFINIFGIHLATKAEALKNWSGEGCEVKTISLTDAAATMLSPKVGILMFHASADGICFGQRVAPVWGSSVYIKDGNRWKWNFGINLPARLAGGY